MHSPCFPIGTAANSLEAKSTLFTKLSLGSASTMKLSSLQASRMCKTHHEVHDYLGGES